MEKFFGIPMGPLATVLAVILAIVIGAAGTMKYQYWRIQREQG